MTNATRDENRVPVLLGTSSADGVTPVPIYVDPTTNRMLTDPNEITNYITYIDEPDANTTYVGEAALGSLTSAEVWRIKKIVVAGDITTILWAESDESFSYEWDERTTYTYG